jgi:hypothetical protein
MIITHLYLELTNEDKEVAWLGIIKFFKKLLNGNYKSGYQTTITYKKINCNICKQLCYNEEDLKQHLRYNHPDVASTETV